MTSQVVVVSFVLLQIFGLGKCQEDTLSTSPPIPTTVTTPPFTSPPLDNNIPNSGPADSNGADQNSQPTTAMMPDAITSPPITASTTTSGPGPLNIPTDLYPTKEEFPPSVSTILPNRNNCGYQNDSKREADASIASLDEFPWIALLRYRYGYYGEDAGFRCAGTLINDRYVVTAAVCVVDSGELCVHSVRLGDWKISSLTDCVYDGYSKECAGKAVEVGIEKKIPHSEYDPSCGRNDIALLRLERKIDFTVFIRPICLPVQDLPHPRVGSILITSGWGATAYGLETDIKSKIRVPVLSNDRCSHQYHGYNRRVFKDQACIGRQTHDHFCTVDSGAPLMSYDDENKPQWYLEGIVSDGFSCGPHGFPGVYIRATNFMKWILDTITKDSLQS